MLRVAVLVLLLANLAYWAWGAGWLALIGLVPHSERDPARMALQQNPDAVRVLPADAARSIVAAASAPPDAAAGARSCLEAGPFTPSALETAERVLAASLPPGSWVRITQAVSAQYGVVLGPFASRETAQKKADELARLRLAFEDVRLPADGAAPAEPAAAEGLSLGRYETRAAAESALAQFNERGVRTARVALLRNPGSDVRLRVDNAAPALAGQVRAISAAALGAAFAPCPAAAANAR